MADSLDDEFLKFQQELLGVEMAAKSSEGENQAEGALPPPERPPPALNLPPPAQQQQQQPPSLAPPPLAPPPRAPPTLAPVPGGSSAQQPPPVQLPPPPTHRANGGPLPPPLAPPPAMQHPSQQGRPHLPPPPMAPPPGGPPRHANVVAAAPTIAAPPQPNPVQLHEPAGPAGMPLHGGMGGGGPYGHLMGMPPPPGGPPFFGGVPTAPAPTIANTRVASQPGKKIGVVRQAAGQRWVDTTLSEWPENDFRIFVGNLGNEVSDAVLTAAFQKFPTFHKAKVVRYAHNGKSKGYGFASFGDMIEGTKVLREMDGKYIGNRPVQLRKGNVDERTVTDKKGRARTREVTIKEPRPQKPRLDGDQGMFGGGRGRGRGNHPPRW